MLQQLLAALRVDAGLPVAQAPMRVVPHEDAMALAHTSLQLGAALAHIPFLLDHPQREAVRILGLAAARFVDQLLARLLPPELAQGAAVDQAADQCGGGRSLLAPLIGVGAVEANCLRMLGMDVLQLCLQGRALGTTAAALKALVQLAQLAHLGLMKLGIALYLRVLAFGGLTVEFTLLLMRALQVLQAPEFGGADGHGELTHAEL
ncbi:MAG: hypothetical protein U1E77_04675 [Inhella sp.]